MRVFQIGEDRWIYRRQSPSSRRDSTRTVALLVICAMALLLCELAITVPARAATGHGFVSSLSQAGTAGLVGPGSVAVDRSSGRVFVGDWEAGFVDVYDAS